MNRDNLWAPWRIEYIRRVDDEPSTSADGCFLCAAWQHPDEDADRLVLHRAEHGMIVLNRYPYTNGHLMVCPGEHVADLPDLAPAARAELMELICLAERLLQAVLNPQGVNVGINIGRAAGAGVPGHLHAHVVPRWAGDTNFMDVVGRVRVIPQAIEDVYAELAGALPKLLEGGEAGG